MQQFFKQYCCTFLSDTPGSGLQANLLPSLLSVPGPFILEVAYNNTSPDLLVRWRPQPNITLHSVQIFTCGNSMLMDIPVNSTCSVLQLSGFNFTEYGFVLVAVQSYTDNICGVFAGVEKKNVVAIDFNNAGIFYSRRAYNEEESMNLT